MSVSIGGIVYRTLGPSYSPFYGSLVHVPIGNIQATSFNGYGASGDNLVLTYDILPGTTIPSFTVNLYAVADGNFANTRSGTLLHSYPDNPADLTGTADNHEFPLDLAASDISSGRDLGNQNPQNLVAEIDFSGNPSHSIVGARPLPGRGLPNDDGTV